LRAAGAEKYWSYGVIPMICGTLPLARRIHAKFITVGECWLPRQLAQVASGSEGETPTWQRGSPNTQFCWLRWAGLGGAVGVGRFCRDFRCLHRRYNSCVSAGDTKDAAGYKYPSGKNSDGAYRTGCRRGIIQGCYRKVTAEVGVASVVVCSLIVPGF
jgi:hypothetical protein